MEKLLIFSKNDDTKFEINLDFYYSPLTVELTNDEKEFSILEYEKKLSNLKNILENRLFNHFSTSFQNLIPERVLNYSKNLKSFLVENFEVKQLDDIDWILTDLNEIKNKIDVKDYKIKYINTINY